jgi:hypothetical protein
MELDQPYSWKGKRNRGGGYGVERTRTKEKWKAKEELAENNTRGKLGSWEDRQKLNSARTM